MEDSFCVAFITYNRSSKLKEAVHTVIPFLSATDEIVIVDNGSDCAEKKALQELIRELKDKFNVKTCTLESNMGVAAGRNIAWRLSSAPFVMFLDDDIIIEEKSLFDKVRSYCLNNPNMGVLHIPTYTPDHGYISENIKILNDELGHTFMLSFWGCAHVICRDKCPFEQLYPNSLFWGYEEHFLAMRIWGIGAEIHRLNEAKIMHCPQSSDAGRMLNREREEHILANHFVVHFLLLPFILRVFYVFFYIGKLIKNKIIRGIEIRNVISQIKKRYNKRERCIMTYKSLSNITLRFGLVSIFQ